MNDLPVKKPGRGRRPKDEVHAAIMKAATRLLFDEGLAAVTVERVSALSGASRVTIHKWWPSKGALAFDAYREAIEPQLGIPDTHDIVADLRVQLHAFARVMTQTPAGRLLCEFVGLAQLDPNLRAALIERYTLPRRDNALAAMRLAQERKQLRDDVDPSVIVDQLWGACYHRLLTSNLPVDEAFVDRLIENLVLGVTSHSDAAQTTR